MKRDEEEEGEEEEEEEETIESKRATQLTACGDRKQKHKLVKCKFCSVNQNKQIAVCPKNENIMIIYSP